MPFRLVGFGYALFFLKLLAYNSPMAKYDVDAACTCPHCRKGVRLETAMSPAPSTPFHGIFLRSPENRDSFKVIVASCPLCGRFILSIFGDFTLMDDQGNLVRREREFLLWPLKSARPVPPEVPSHIAQDYSESALVFSFSSKASAALRSLPSNSPSRSRRINEDRFE